jgi:tRNA threonylcarbamoyladenosine biosynthesis protein TsaE
VVEVRGELGAGKTTFVRAACRALGVEGAVASPTYVVGRRYRTAAGGVVSHLDLYRSRGLGDEEWADLEAYFDDGPVFVEWPEAGAGVLPPARAVVAIVVVEDDARLVTLTSPDTELMRALDPPLA